MHDAFGRELKVGDRVMVPMTVVALHLTADYCNVQLKSVATMPPNHDSHIDLGAVNTVQILRANDGDDLKYQIQHGPLSQMKIVPAFEDDDPSTVPEGTGDTWGPPLRKPVR